MEQRAGLSVQPHGWAAVEQQPATGEMVLAGLVAATGGFLVGAMLTDFSGLGQNELGYVIVGGLVGQALLLPLAVHGANRRRGRYWPSAQLGMGTGAVAIGLLLISPEAAPASLLVAPLVQLPLTLLIESRTMNRSSPSQGTAPRLRY